MSPYPTVTNKLCSAASGWMILDKSLLATSQLPSTVIDKKGRTITKPATW